MEIRPLYRKDEKPQDYALRVLKLLANVGFSNMLDEYYSSFVLDKEHANDRIILLEHNNDCSGIELSECKEVFAISHLCGDYWDLSGAVTPFAIIERELEDKSVFDLYDSFYGFFCWHFKRLLSETVSDDTEYRKRLDDFEPDHFGAEDYTKVIEMAKTAKSKGGKTE